MNTFLVICTLLAAILFARALYVGTSEYKFDALKKDLRKKRRNGR